MDDNHKGLGETDEGRAGRRDPAPVSRVLVTGAAGRVGPAVCKDLAAHRIEFVAADRRPGPGVARVDMGDLDAVRTVAEGCDAVIHLAAHPSPGGVAAHELFANNTQAAFHALTTAVEQGMSTVVMASSISAYGMTFAHRPFSPRYAPIDEDHELTPQDVYGLSKVINEETAHAFARTHPIGVVALRFHWVAGHPQVRTRVQQLADGTDRMAIRELWSYVDARDAAAACRGALAVRRGFHALNICAPDTLSNTPTSQLMARHHPGTEIRGNLDPHHSPWSTDRAREVIGFTARWTWRSDAPLEAAAR